MRLSQELSLGIAALLGLQLVTSFAAIGLLGRMTPAVRDILEENVTSLVATEHMLAALVEPPGPEASEALRSWLDHARRSATEPEELPLLDRIEALLPAAAAGDPAARAALVEAVQALGGVNRATMERADLAARDQGTAGAWAAALLGMGSFLVGALVNRRLRMRLELPILEVDEALSASRRNDPHRRCVDWPAPVEVRRIGENVNWLLDHGQRASTVEADDRLRQALLYVLDRQPEPMALVQAGHEVMALNVAAVALWDDPERSGQVAELLSGRPVEGWTSHPVAEGLALWTRPSDERPPDQ